MNKIIKCIVWGLVIVVFLHSITLLIMDSNIRELEKNQLDTAPILQVDTITVSIDFKTK